jgi:polyhydroxybutyrate depolymerase
LNLRKIVARRKIMRSRFRIGSPIVVYLLCLQCSSDATPASATGGAGGMIYAVSGGGSPALGAGGVASIQAGGTPPISGSGGSLVSGNGGMLVGSGGTIVGSSGAGNSGANQSTGGGGVAANGGANSGGAMSAGGSGGAPGNCGTRSGMRGKTLRTVTVSGTKRTYVAYLPPSGNAAAPLPLVYVFHGATQTGQNMYDITQYQVLADKEGIAVVYPDGQSTSSATGAGNLAPWNVTDGAGLCGLGSLVSNPNPVDLPFVDAIKADIAMDQCIDAGHVFATGFSMGGYFTHHIACDRPDFKAAGPHSGGTIADLSSCKTAHMPIIIFHGTSDPLISEVCDDPTATEQPGFPPSATLWAKKNGCQNTYKTVTEMGSTMGNNGQCYIYDGCPADGQVEACTFTNMPHAWAGAAMCPGCIGTGAGYADATQLEWDFFKKYAW